MASEIPRQSLALVLIITIVLSCGLLYILNLSNLAKEGFQGPDEQKSYEQLQSNLKNTLGPYCSLASFMQDQMKTMLMTQKVSESGEPIPGDTAAEAADHMKRAYEDAYACRDELAKSRPSCSGAVMLSQGGQIMEFIPCSVYLGTPIYTASDTSQMSLALSAIPDDLAARITKETEWYSAIINKLQSGIDAGAHPPTTLPKDAPGANWKPEAFEDFSELSQKLRSNKTCSSDAVRIRKEKQRQLQLEAEAETCSIPDLNAQIDRVSRILNSKALATAVGSCAAIQAAATKLQSDMIKLKAGNLYEWQQTGPAKSYTQFKGGDHSAAFVFSVQQNR